MCVRAYQLYICFMQLGLINLMDINDHIIRTHLLEAEFSAVCDISRDNYSQAVHTDERKRKKTQNIYL